MSGCCSSLLLLTLFFSEGLIVRKCCLTVGWGHGLTSKCGSVESDNMLLPPIHSGPFYSYISRSRDLGQGTMHSVDRSRVPRPSHAPRWPPVPGLHIHTPTTTCCSLTTTTAARGFTWPGEEWRPFKKRTLEPPGGWRSLLQINEFFFVVIYLFWILLVAV